jgi:serine/threonine-protein kinase HipA
VTVPAAVTELRVFYHRRHDEQLLMGRLAYRDGQAAFEYNTEFGALDLELSPFKLPLAEGIVLAKPDVLDGLFGLFDDSLPDGWGRLLLDRYVEKLGGKRQRLTPLDRLARVGSGAIGALSYEPGRELEQPDTVDLHRLGKEALTVLEDRTSDALETLLSVGGSPQGARPKALVLLAPDGEKIVTGTDYREGFDPYLVKFSSNLDPKYAGGAIEFAYSNMARASGVVMPSTRLLAPKGNHRGYFAIERFDRRGPGRVHTQTVCGLLEAPPLVAMLTYENILNLTRELTRDARQVEQMFRRVAFNVYAHNRDDHSRNFAYAMDPDGTWNLAPAYDLTFSDGPGGEHHMLVADEGRSPTSTHLHALAAAVDVKRSAASEAIDQVRAACSEWARFADEARVPKAHARRIGKTLEAIGKN